MATKFFELTWSRLKRFDAERAEIDLFGSDGSPRKVSPAALMFGTAEMKRRTFSKECADQNFEKAKLRDLF
jgi:hypothetical protein